MYFVQNGKDAIKVFTCLFIEMKIGKHICYFENASYDFELRIIRTKVLCLHEEV